ncbi:MAG: zinc ABC transporter substrate-binding protein [Anaerolineae bacterium]
MKLKISIVMLACLMALSGCTGAANEAQAQGKINVVTTVGMITDIARVVGGDRVSVIGLMGPGVDPHLYRAAAGDVKTLGDADIIFYGGLHLEGKMADVFERVSKRIPTYPVGEGVPVDQRLTDPNYPQFADPHIWFDVSFWSLAVGRIQDGLSALDPDHAAEYQQRASDYQAKLRTLDEYVKTAIQTIPESQRVMITSHDAFRYFGRRYGIEVLALQGISTEAEASVEDVRHLTGIVVQRKIPAMFIESSVPQRTIEAVQAAVRDEGWDVKIGGELFSDAMGDAGTLEGTYIGMILHNVNTITTALGGNMPPLPDDLADYQAVVKGV